MTGLEKAPEESPDLVLLDVMMPGVDGWGVAEQLLEDQVTSSIPIIFLTARPSSATVPRGLDIGGVDYVTKPFNPLEYRARSSRTCSTASTAASATSCGARSWPSCAR